MATRILGIDPGSRYTGFGLIDKKGNDLRYVAAGRVSAGDGGLTGRLEVIFTELSDVVEKQTPDVAAIEGIFHHRNADSALKLGHARGVAIVACRLQGLDLAEYAPTVIKKSVVGHGRAEKRQVQEMVRMILSLGDDIDLATDAADALAVAICHAHHSHTGIRSRRSGKKRKASAWEQIAEQLEAKRRKRQK